MVASGTAPAGTCRMMEAGHNQTGSGMGVMASRWTRGRTRMKPRGGRCRGVGG